MTKQDFLNFIGRYLGLPYIWGSDDPAVGLDCSGYMQILLRQLNADPPGDQTADELMRQLKKSGRVLVTDEVYELCDVLFFGANGHASHITMAVNGSQMTEAAHGDHTCTTVEKAREKGASVQLNPINRRHDLICAIRLDKLPWES